MAWSRTANYPPHRGQRGRPSERKVRYKTHAAALNALVARLNRGHGLEWLYPCAYCEGWHAASSPPRHPDGHALLAGLLPR